MSNTHADDGEVGRETSGVGRRAWAGRTMVAFVPLAVLVATGHQMLHLRAEERWWEFSGELRRAPLPETRQAIDAGVEEAFAPVYAAIPSLLDWHYSTLGRYTELGLALFGKLDEEIESRLFGELEEGIGLVADDVGRVMQGEVLAELERWFGGDVGALPTGWGRGPGRALETLLEDARRHFVVAIGPTTVGAAMAGVGTSVGVRTVAAGVAGRLTSGIGSAILSTAGRTAGPAAGIIGGVAGWLAVDYALREFEEWRGRDELEHALTALVDEEKERVRAALVSAVDEVKVTALGDFVPFRLR